MVRTRLPYLLALAAFASPTAAGTIAAGPVLRAVYLAGNPVQAVRDPATGEVRGPAFDVAQELARQEGVTLDFKPAGSPAAIIDAVERGEADIGFVAYEPSRAGSVSFSEPYMVVPQSFLVSAQSPIRALRDIDVAGRSIGGTGGDSVTLCMKRTFRAATVVELPGDPAAIAAALSEGKVDAFAANRTRLAGIAALVPGARQLDEAFFNVPQNIVVPRDRLAAKTAIDRFIAAARDGFLAASIARGRGAAPARPGMTIGCPAL